MTKEPKIDKLFESKFNKTLSIFKNKGNYSLSFIKKCTITSIIGYKY
jgi:hypothetical protein